MIGVKEEVGRDGVGRVIRRRGGRVNNVLDLL